MSLSLTVAASLLGGAANGSGAISASASLLLFRRAQLPNAATKAIAAEKKDPVTLTALAQFKLALGKAKDVTAALRDPRVLAVVLPAFGLADQADYPGLVQKALLADPKDPKGMLAGLDSRFKAAATTLDLRTKGLAGLTDPKVQQTLTDGYLQYQYQKGLDTQAPGMSDALYFLKNAAATKDVYGLLGNAVMRRVVTSALGLPPQLAIQPIDSQAKAITSRLPLADLKDPKKVQMLAQRYLMTQADGAGTGGSSNLLVSLFA
jgi:Protein of unknown function (DUF1217)